MQFPSGPCVRWPYSQRPTDWLSSSGSPRTLFCPEQAVWLSVFGRQLVLVSWTHAAFLCLCLAQGVRGLLSHFSTVSPGAAAGTHREIREYPFPLFVDLDNLYPEITLLVFRISQRFSWTGFLELLPIILFPAELTLCTLGGQGAKRQPVYNTFLISISVFPRSERLHWETNKTQTNETEIKNIFCLLPTPKHLTEQQNWRCSPLPYGEWLGAGQGWGLGTNQVCNPGMWKWGLTISLGAGWQRWLWHCPWSPIF